MPGGGCADCAAVVLALAPAAPAGVSLVDVNLRSRAESLLGVGPADWATEVARATCALIVEESFEGEEAPPVSQIGEASETALLVLLLRLAGHSASPASGTVRQSEIIRYRISHATPFQRVVGSQRLAQHRWADLLLAAAVRQHAGPEAMRTIVATLDRYFDEGIDWHLRFYLAEQERYLHSEAAERARLVDAIVAGRDVDSAVARSLLGADLADPHVAVVLQDAADHQVDPEGRMQQVISEVGRSASSTAVSHRPAAGVAWLWLAGRDAATVDTIEHLLRDNGVRAGVGESHAGADGFRRSHVEAGDALRFARHPHKPLVRHRDVALAALLSSDLERARWFVRERLGGLARSDAKSAELRDTLAEYYRVGTRLSVAAAALHVHRNTLLYRLRHITELLGHSVSEVMPEVQCALLLASEFGDAVLELPTAGPSAARHLSRLTALHVG